MMRALLLFAAAWILQACQAGSPHQATIAGVEKQTDEAPAADADEVDANADIAAAVPHTDIWLLPLAKVLAGDERPGAKNITRRRGYDNQPAFSPDGKHILFASIRDGRQADVFDYDIETGQTRQVTATSQSEYSPTPRPGGGFSTVRVADDGSQRLWLYDDSGDPKRAVRDDITGVGYHAWLDDSHLALFIVAEPMNLIVAGTREGEVLQVASNIGRSLHRRKGDRLAYVRKLDEENWYVHEYDWRTGEDRRLAATLPGMEDLAWLEDGSALMANGRGLYRLADGASQWVLLSELAYDIPGDIGRLAVDPSGQWLAVVVTQTE